ncbi:MAG: hypothetical protein KAH20_10865 [Methylococcales bacterium]|nr:hypothetical protein [Methylococcales bacterium]
MTTVRDYVNDHYVKQNGVFTIDSLTKRINELVASMDKLYAFDVSRWGFKPDLHILWKNEVNRMISEFPARMAFLKGKVQNEEMFHTLSSVTISETVLNKTVIMTNTNQGLTEVYFTVDGTDPMGNDGAISNSAILYGVGGYFPQQSGAVTITARAYQVNNWGQKYIANLVIE